MNADENVYWYDGLCIQEVGGSNKNEGSRVFTNYCLIIRLWYLMSVSPWNHRSFEPWVEIEHLWTEFWAIMDSKGLSNIQGHKTHLQNPYILSKLEYQMCILRLWIAHCKSIHIDRDKQCYCTKTRHALQI